LVGRLILVRHAESEGNRDRRFTTSPAVPLTARGREQAKEVAERIGRQYRPKLVITSPYARARETAEIIADALGLDLHVEDGLREQSYGRLAGKPYDVVFEIPGYDPARVWEWEPPGGESLVAVQKRVLPVFCEIGRRYPEGDVVVVSHGGVMMAVRAAIEGRWEGLVAPPNTGIYVIEHEMGRFKSISIENS